MPRFEVTSPDGRKFEITAPDGTTAEDVERQIAGTLPPVSRPAAPGNIPRAAAAGASRGVLGSLDIVPRGIAGLYNTLAAPVGLPTWQGTPFANFGALPERFWPGTGIGTYQPQTVPEERAAFTGEMLGASVLPGAAMTPAGGLRAFGGEMLAGVGAGVGGLASEAAGYGRMPGIVAGSLAPSAAAAATRRAILPTRVPVARERIAAARRQDVPISAGQAAGGSWVEKVAETIPGGTQAKQRMVEKQADRIKTRLDELSKGTQGSPEPSATAAGQQITKGIDNWSNQFKAEGKRLYDEAEAIVPNETPVEPLTLYRELQSMRGSGAFAGITDNPFVERLAKKLDELEAKFRAGELDAPVTMKDVTELRTMIGGKMATPMIIADTPRAQLKRLYAAVSSDIENTLGRVGGDQAVSNWQDAVGYWRQGMQRLDDFLEPIERRKTPEEVYTAAMRGSKEGATRLRELEDTLQPEQWDVVRRTALKELGKSRPSSMQFEGATQANMEFNTETFLTNLGKYSDEARNVLFRDMRDLDDLINIASGHRAQERYIGNLSGTARLLTNTAIPTGMVGAYFDPTVLLPLARVAGSAWGTQRFLQSPMGLNWLTGPVSPLQQGLAGIAPRLSVGMDDQPLY